jgi:hypothetical protein
MRIPTNFRKSTEFIESPGGGRAEIIRSESWPEVRKQLRSADLIVIDCRDLLLFWFVAVDVVLRKPGWRLASSQRVARPGYSVASEAALKATTNNGSAQRTV